MWCVCEFNKKKLRGVWFWAWAKHKMLQAHTHTHTLAHVHTLIRASISKNERFTISFSRLQSVFACENHRSVGVVCVCAVSFILALPFAKADFSPSTQMTDRAHSNIAPSSLIDTDEDTDGVSWCKLVLFSEPNHILSRSTALVNCGSQFRKNSSIPWSSIAVCVRACVSCGLCSVCRFAVLVWAWAKAMCDVDFKIRIANHRYRSSSAPKWLTVWNIFNCLNVPEIDENLQFPPLKCRFLCPLRKENTFAVIQFVLNTLKVSMPMSISDDRNRAHKIVKKVN